MIASRETLSRRLPRTCQRLAVSIREAGRQADVSHSAIVRAYNGLPFDWLAYVKITAWLDQAEQQPVSEKAA